MSIKAKNVKTGATAEFSEPAWELIAVDKDGTRDGWVINELDAPAEVKETVNKKNKNDENQK